MVNNLLSAIIKNVVEKRKITYLLAWKEKSVNENKLRAALSSEEDCPWALTPGDLCVSKDIPASALLCTRMEGKPVTQSCHCSCSLTGKCHANITVAPDTQHPSTRHQQIILHSGVVNDMPFLRLTGPGAPQCLYHVTLTHGNQQPGKTGKSLNDPSSV